MAEVTRRLDRVETLQTSMRDLGVDLVVVGPSANMRYLTGYRAMAVERITVLLVTPTAVAMVMPYFDVDEFRELTGIDAVFEWTDSEGPQRAIERAFSALDVPGGRMAAAVDDELRFDFWTQLRDRIDGHPRRASELLAPLRLSKSADELEKIRRAGELVSSGIAAALEHARPGMTELELKRVIENALWDGGAESADFVLVQAGANSASGHHQADDTPIRPGEPVLVDIAARADGYFADITQQVFLGEPPERYKEMYQVVADAQEAGVQAVREGARACEVHEAASAVIDAAGFGEWSGPRTGHGIGLDVHEPPSVVDTDATVLPVGAVITVEPGIYISGEFGIRIEDTVLVRAGAPERLTRGARALFSK
ncbi:MAG TPA: Xaa-Pro peptidase family protein [Actinomycetota bacterium]|nr:Xaa-Pro peptidase family protein [Actinomycetota bacterium]